MNILALDFGTKNIGLAWADTGIGTALPFGVINNTDSEKRNRELDKLVEREKIDKIVIGLPLGMDGKENENTERVRKFAKDLESFLPVSIDFF
jgi:putative Holliday junction resolvase